MGKYPKPSLTPTVVDDRGKAKDNEADPFGKYKPLATAVQDAAKLLPPYHATGQWFYDHDYRDITSPEVYAEAQHHILRALELLGSDQRWRLLLRDLSTQLNAYWGKVLVTLPLQLEARLAAVAEFLKARLPEHEHAELTRLLLPEGKKKK